uniref:hypothetical protein n=1 Tax=Prevotella sp. TaxID=59823 RepID=UPI004025331A
MKLKTLLFCSLLAIGFVSCGGDDNDDNENGSGSTSTEVINGHKFVNLGLPSGTLWAETNVGAKSKSDIGEYYAWGEIETKDSYKEYNYKWSEGYHGSVLLPEDDVATQKWGAGVHIPTKEQARELVDNCEFVWTSVKGQNGYKVVGKNGNSIFLPAGGYYSPNPSHTKLVCIYWLNYHGWRLFLDYTCAGTEDEFCVECNNDYIGQLVRPVASI